MRYSVIIPTLNEEKLLLNLLQQLANSVWKQKYDYELIISDAGSDDKTIEIALKYADVVKENSSRQVQNIAIGRNIGASSASGEIFIFFDADIILKEPEKFFDHLNKNFYNSSYPALTCKVKIPPKERKISDLLFHAFYNFYFKLLNLIGIGMGRGECQVIRREIFEECGGYNINLPAGEDFDLFRRIRKKGKIKFADELIVYESPRRYRKYGYLKVFWLWSKNGFSIFFSDKAYSKKWEPVR